MTHPVTHPVVDGPLDEIDHGADASTGASTERKQRRNDQWRILDTGGGYCMDSRRKKDGSGEAEDKGRGCRRLSLARRDLSPS